MSSESYKYGLERGALFASLCRKEIVEANTSEKLGKLAGKKLLSASQAPVDFLMNYDGFKIGFFDGFMAKAEEMMSRRREK